MVRFFLDFAKMDTSNSEDETLQCGKSDANTRMDSLPAKSREIYLKTYESFMEWRTAVGAKDFSESVLLAYFKELAKTKQASTLWSTYSKLRATVSANNNVNLNTYSKVLIFLKSQAKGHKTKKSKVLTAQNVESFLVEAPDEIYLAMKVVLIFGISGACRVVELLRIKPDDVQKHSDQAMLVTLFSSSSPTKIERSFVIRDKYVKIVEKYQALRPPDTELDRFFINYQQGKCTKQVIGKNKLCEIPKRIAEFLELPNPEMYTGHCLRRTSACLLAQSGADAVLLKQCGGWKSTNGIAEYLEGTYTKRVRIDPPRILPQPTENLQDESPLPKIQQYESTLNNTQHYEPLNNTQQTQTQWEISLTSNTQVNQWRESVDTQQVSQQETRLNETVLNKTEQDSMLNGTETQWSPIDDCPSVTTDDPFDLIPEEYVMPPSPSQPPAPRRKPRPLYSAVRRLAALEQRRLKLDEVRARQLHARETRRLRVRARQLEVDRDRNEVLRRIADVATAWLERLSRL